MKHISIFIIPVLLLITVSVFGLEEGFESGQFRSPFWTSYHSDLYNQEKWIPLEEAFYAHSGDWVARCLYDPDPNNNATLKMVAEITMPVDGTMTFWYRSTLTAGSTFAFKIDGTTQSTPLSGSWRQPVPPNLPITAGTHTLEWIVYANKGNSGALFLDDISITGSSVADPSNTQTYGVMGKNILLDGTLSNAHFYNWSQTAGTTVQINNSTLDIANFTAPTGLSAAETLTFQLQVDNDGTDPLATDTVDVIIGGNPVADAGGDQDVMEAATVTVDAIGTMAASSPWDVGLTYSWTVLNSGGTTLPTGPSAFAAPTSQSTTFTAPDIDPGESATIVVQLTVTNLYGGSSTDTISVTVYDTDTPIADAGADQVVEAGTVGTVTIDASGSTLNGTPPFTYTWTAISADALEELPAPQVSTSDTDFSFSYPQYMGFYTYTFELTVTNNEGYSTTDQVTIEASSAPVADAGDDDTLTDNLAYQLDGRGSFDPEGKTLTYSWAQTAGTGVTWTSATNIVNPTFTVDVGSPTVLTFQLTVTDPHGFTDTDTVDIKVYDIEDPHAVATAVPLIADELETGIQLDGSGSYDSQTTITYSWAQTGGTGGTFETATNIVNPTFTAPDLASGNTIETIDITLTVTDANTNTDTDTVQIKVYGDTAPHAVAGPDFTAYEGKGITLNGSGSYDPDAGDTLTYNWTQIAGPPFDTGGADMTLASPSFSVGSLDSTVVLVFQLTVTSSGGGSDTDTVTVTLRNGGGGGGGGGGGCSFAENSSASSIIPLLIGGLLLLCVRRFRKD